MKEKLNPSPGTKVKFHVSRGQIHNFLGMTFDYSYPVRVKISMMEYIRDIFDKFPDEKKVKTEKIPATEILCVIRKESEKFSGKLRNILQLCGKIFYVSIRTRHDISLEISFLTTCVTYPENDDWKYLCRCIRYLRVQRTLL